MSLCDTFSSNYWDRVRFFDSFCFFPAFVAIIVVLVVLVQILVVVVTAAMVWSKAPGKAVSVAIAVAAFVAAAIDFVAVAVVFASFNHNEVVVVADLVALR